MLKSKILFGWYVAYFFFQELQTHNNYFQNKKFGKSNFIVE